MLYSSCPKVRTPARVPESCPPKKGCFLGCFFLQNKFFPAKCSTFAYSMPYIFGLFKASWSVVSSHSAAKDS